MKEKEEEATRERSSSALSIVATPSDVFAICLDALVRRKISIFLKCILKNMKVQLKYVVVYEIYDLILIEGYIT